MKRRFFLTATAFVLLCCIFAAFTPVRVAAQPSDAVVRVGFFAFDGYHMTDERGVRSGYGYEYMLEMAKYTDWVYDYKGYDASWADAQEMLENGEIDILTSAQKTDARLEKFDFSDAPIGISATILTVKAGDTKFLAGEYSSFNGIRVGMIEGNSRNNSFAEFARENGFSYVPVLFESTEKMMEELQSGGVIDAVVTSNLRAVENEWIVAQFDASPYYVMVKKGNSALLEQVNYAIEQIGIDSPKQVNYAIEQIGIDSPSLQSELFDKYYSAESGDDIAFTKSEREFIEAQAQSGTPLTAMIRPSKEPVSCYLNGEASGIIGELSNEIIRRTGLNVKFLQPADYREYEAIISASGADIVFDMHAVGNEAEMDGYKLTSSYMTLRYAQLSVDGSTSGKGRVAALENDKITSDYIKSAYPDSQITYYATLDECVDAVLSGRQDVYCTDVYSASFIVYNDVANRLSYTTFADSAASIAVGISDKADYRLVSVFNKTVQSLSDLYISSVINRRTNYPVPAFSLVRYFYAHPALSFFALTVFFAALMVVIISIARTRRRRERVRQNKEILRFVSYVCKANDVVIEFDIKMNKACRYAVENGEVVRKNEESTVDDLLKTVHPDEASELEKIFRHENLKMMIENQQDVYIECRMRGASDEDYRWYALMLQSMEADTEHSLRVMLYVRDIDETKKNELLKRIALEDALAAAETSNTAKSDFLSRMSHEIRTPLNAIIGFSTLAENEVISPKVREYLGKMQVSSKLLLSVINDILDMSAIENQKLKIAKASFSLKEIMLSISTVYYSICRQKGLDFKITASGVTDERIVGDEMRVNQVLLNLLSNAVKFTESGGAVSLTVEQLAHTREDKIFMRFTVTDTGCGMSEDMLLRLFRPFEQQDAKIASRHGGSGLGLSISKSLVSLMGGDIRVSSELKKGTTFTVDLPFEKAEPETGAFSVSFDKLRILVVDNDTDTIDYISAIMRRIGIRYDVAQSGEQAVSMIKAAQDEGFEYNVCFLDWKMNGMDGLDVARIIRKDFQSKVVLIVMSAYDITEIRSEGAAIGVDMFVAKPLFQSTVVDLLTELVVKRTASVPSGMSAASSYDFSGKRALIIDDNTINMEVSVGILQSTGIETDSAFSGGEAIKKFKASEPGYYDIIFMDIQMPDMNGYEATRIIRALGREDAQSVPILAMTADAFTQDVAKAVSAGMNDHVAKPIDPNKLFMTMKRYL